MRKCVVVTIMTCGLVVMSHGADKSLTAVELIARIPKGPVIAHLRQEALTAASETERQEAKKTLLSAVEDFRKLKPLLKVGSSLSDYPGLRTLHPGEPSYDAKTHLYTMDLGTYTLIAEGSEQCFFKVRFDEGRIIREVKSYMLLF